MAQETIPPEEIRPEPAISRGLPVISGLAAVCLVGGLASAPDTLLTVWMAVAAACTAAAVAEAVRRGREFASQRARIAALQHTLARQEAAAAHLAEVVMDEAIRRLRQGELPEEVLSSLGGGDARGRPWSDDPYLTPRFKAALRTVVARAVDAVDNEEGLRDSAQRAFVNIARRVQALVHQQAHELREMEDRHGRNPDVFGDLLRLDHGTALIGRLADSISVLGGARPGRQWSRAVTLYSVLRGAMSRIIDYQRVDLHSVAEVAILGPVVEPLIHAVAELLDNATRYSPPHTRVHLTASEVQSGVAVEIEDGGLSMSEEARRRAENMLARAQTGIDLNDLGETPRLGLAVVGRLAQAYGLQVSLRSSAYGGVRAVVVVPQHLVTTASAATGLAHGIGSSSGPRAAVATAREHPVQHARPARVPVPGPGTPSWATRAAAPAPTTPATTTAVPDRTASGLPQRRRKDRVTAPDVPPAAAPHTTPENGPGMWLEAFHSGLSGGTGGGPSGSSGQDQDTPGSATKGRMQS
ncbi:sensor histidine kinase [Streptomyces sp. NPDC012888]|uniref:sensor histidine kinase n=1 Tax=Streptomyces sp. NPDC012888 TaxID=3364855 RepID=UPI0036C355A2